MRFLILLCLAIPFHTFAETSVWKVSKGSSELFIGGTIHVLSADDYPLPDEFSQAYRQAQMVVLETDLAAMAKPEIQQQLIKRMRYRKGNTVKNDLSEESYKALSDYLLSIGLSIEMFKQYKVSMIVISLLMNELQRLGMANTGVDHYFNSLAKDEGKALSQLESVEVQLDVLENLGKGHEDEIILSTIKEMKELSLIMGSMKKAWRTGDTQTLEDIGLSPMKRDFPVLYQLLLVDRNNAWLPKIEALLLTPEVEFVLMGALHLVGTEGIITRLQQLGYEVELY